MSYVRWSSPLKLSEPCPECGRPPDSYYSEDVDGWMAKHQYQMRWAGGPWWVRILLKLRTTPKVWRDPLRIVWTRPAFFLYRFRRGLCHTCTSHWYVYWDCGGGDDRDSQLLAIYPAGNHDTNLYDYPWVKERLERADFEVIPGFVEYGDQGVLRTSLEEWCKEVEKEYPT